MSLYSLETVSTMELALAVAMVLPTIGFCLWQKRPFLLWMLHSVMAQYLCLYWLPWPYGRCVVGLLATIGLVLLAEKRTAAGV